MTVNITHGLCYGDLVITEGGNPSKMQDDVALRVNTPPQDTTTYSEVYIRRYGLPIRHDCGKLKIKKLDADEFTADLGNSHGDLDIKFLKVNYDGSDFTEEDYELYHPDAGFQFYDYKTKDCGNVNIPNIEATITGDLIQFMMLSEAHDYHNFNIGRGNVDISIQYKYAFVANNLRDSYIDVGNNGVKIMNVKDSEFVSSNVTIVRYSDDQLIDVDFEANIVNKKHRMKIALIIGHNKKYQGKKIFGSSEYLFWKEFLHEYIDQWKTDIELKIFERPAIRSYSKQVRDVHDRIDSWGANISVSCHFNAFSGNVHGHEVLYAPNSKGGKLFAETFNTAMNKHLTNNNRGHKPAAERGRYGLTYGKSKTILIEPFFAKQLKDYQPGGKHRNKLFNSFQAFFDSVAGQKPEIVVKRTAMFTEEELEFAMSILT